MIAIPASKQTAYTQFQKNTTDENTRIFKGIGAHIVSGMSLEEQIECAGLGWDVNVSDIRYGSEFQHQSQYKQAIYRSDNGLLLDVTGSRWKPFQNREILQTFRQFCDDAGLELEHLGELRQGRTIFATAKLNEHFSLTREDVTDGRVLITNYHECGAGLRVDLMAIAKVCTNGMTQPVRVGSRVISHVEAYNQEKITRVLDAAKDNFRELQHQTERLANAEMSEAEFTLLLIQEFGDATKTLEQQPRIVRMCLKLFNGTAKGATELSRYRTAYGALSAVTEYFNHHSIQRGGIATHLNSLWLGNKAKQQQQFMRQLVSVYS